MDVQTDHQIVSFPPDGMALFDNRLDQPGESGVIIVQATRVNGVWTLSTPQHEHSDVVLPAVPANDPPRQALITAMVDLALEISPGDGYSTVVPRGLEWLP